MTLVLDLFYRSSFHPPTSAVTGANVGDELETSATTSATTTTTTSTSVPTVRSKLEIFKGLGPIFHRRSDHSVVSDEGKYRRHCPRHERYTHSPATLTYRPPEGLRQLYEDRNHAVDKELNRLRKADQRALAKWKKGALETVKVLMEVNRRGSPHTHLVAERFLQAREVSSAEAVFRVFGPQRKAPARPLVAYGCTCACC